MGKDSGGWTPIVPGGWNNLQTYLGLASLRDYGNAANPVIRTFLLIRLHQTHFL